MLLFVGPEIHQKLIHDPTLVTCCYLCVFVDMCSYLLIFVIFVNLCWYLLVLLDIWSLLLFVDRWSYLLILFVIFLDILWYLLIFHTVGAWINIFLFFERVPLDLRFLRSAYLVFVKPSSIITLTVRGGQGYLSILFCFR